jgi:hypothetical protein
MILLLAVMAFASLQSAHGQASDADVAAYQLGVTAEALPGAELVYAITVTNYGPAPVKSFYVVDGWSINADGIAAFAQPIGDPDFGKFNLNGSWAQDRKDQKVVAWLIDGALSPGDTVQFNWKVKVAESYQGGLVNWVRVQTSGSPDGKWQPRNDTAALTPPEVSNAADPDTANNRSPDGVTVISNAPTGRGVDMAIYQAGFLSQLKASEPIQSTWLVTNLGPETVKQFYLEAGWSLGPDKNSLLVQPTPDPEFGAFKVLGRWRQIRQDEELWLWLLEGDLKAGGSAFFKWERSIIPAYRGDLVNWSRIFAHDTPPGEWVAREGTSATPQALSGSSDTDPANDRSADGVSTVLQ